MTPNEFKAWFDGFTEAFDGRIPTKAQWGRINERVAEIDGKPVTERVYVDRYWPLYPQYPYTRYGGASGIGLAQSANAAQQYSQALSANNSVGFNSSAAMANLGRAEAKALAA